MYDERYTSKLALQAMIESGASKKTRRNKALLDSISATILLQNYLEFLKFNKK
ncbi:MAG: Holliday junction resolvase RuvX, partial [Bacteroidetes bacterium]|nr:Holliday junction resolvase RuvX [Bacteroidota bacterium]